MNIEIFRNINYIMETLENPQSFFCETCNYRTAVKQHYAKHLATRKHENNTKQNQKIFKCKVCQREYRARTSCWYHEKKCRKKVEDAIAKKEQKEQAERDKERIDREEKSNAEKLKNYDNNIALIRELLQQNKELQEQILKLSSENRNVITTNNNMTNNNFNLSLFLNETCKDAVNLMDFVDSLNVTMNDFETTGRVGYAEGVSQIIINGLKKMDVHKRPVHCTDVKRETMYVKDQNIWEKENQEKTRLIRAVQQIADKNLQVFQEWQKVHPDSKMSNTKENEYLLNLVMTVMGGRTPEEDRKNQEKILRNIAKEVAIEKGGSVDSDMV
jgi:hypothetical protein